MRAPAGRGLVAIGNAAGQLVLADPRTGKLSLGTAIMHPVSPYALICDCNRPFTRSNLITSSIHSLPLSLSLPESYQECSTVIATANGVKNLPYHTMCMHLLISHHCQTRVAEPACSSAPNATAKPKIHSKCNRISTQQYGLGQHGRTDLLHRLCCFPAAPFDSKCDAGYKVEHTVTAHSGGLQALDARGNFLATCGYSMRLGQLALDNTVKVLASLYLNQHLCVCTPTEQ